jgi:uncharacterized small protein (DUF1192 family)
MTTEDQMVPSDDSLVVVAELAKRQVTLEQEIEKLETQLKEKSEELKQVQEKDLPEALSECGLSEIKLLDGSKVTVKPYYQANPPKERYDEAMQWLRDNGHGDLIKNDVTVSFGKGEDNRAEDFKVFLRDNGTSYVDKTGVHAMTFKAFVREQVETGKNLPFDLLGVYIGQKATIKKG